MKEKSRSRKEEAAGGEKKKRGVFSAYDDLNSLPSSSLHPIIVLSSNGINKHTLPSTKNRKRQLLPKQTPSFLKMDTCIASKNQKCSSSQGKGTGFPFVFLQKDWENGFLHSNPNTEPLYQQHIRPFCSLRPDAGICLTTRTISVRKKKDKCQTGFQRQRRHEEIRTAG